jgi:hypothetical protein
MLCGIVTWISMIILSGGQLIAVELLEIGARASEHFPPLLSRFIQRGLAGQRKESLSVEAVTAGQEASL